ncbi:MAG: methyltransferase domain-containing protein [Bdellovibrionaceae bacterium]|nr:methyltransferase domain-containing protein [Pseudobdellovibrionaceae bacterium]
MHDDHRNEANRHAYESVARKYAGDAPGEDDPSMRRSCRECFIGGLNGKQVLEVGCGPGVDASFLEAAGLDVTASDFSKEFIQIVQERFPKIKTHQMDMTKPDLPDESFDGIYAFASFIHLPRASAGDALAGFRRLLRHPGVLFMSLIRSSKVAEYSIEDWGGRPNNPLLFTCYQPAEIEALLRAAHFKRIEFQEIRSKLYEELPRLTERGVSHYQVMAFT